VAQPCKLITTWQIALRSLGKKLAKIEPVAEAASS
jgi:hypothetical protein